MLPQIINNSKRALYRHWICCPKKVCTPRFKKNAMSHNYQAVFYSTINRNPNVNLRSETFNHEYKGSTTTKSTSNRTFRQYERLKKLNSHPLSDLSRIYEIVNKEFSKTCLALKYTLNNKSVNERVKCCIDVTWPVNFSFSCTGPNKKIASEKAASMCMNWLYAHNKIDGMNPNLYNYKDIQRFLASQKNIRINLAPQLKMEIQSLIDTFNNIDLQTASKISKDDLETDDNLLNLDISSNLNSTKKKKYNESRQNYVNDLPISQYKDEILSKLQSNQILLIKGDTGCGKSTQVPQFIIDAYIKENRESECNILVSEPRRIAAVSLAKHVAMQRKEHLGNVVGYHVRFNQIQPHECGSILYCTTGIFLRRLESDPTLKGVSHVIIDEVHERNLQTDLILKLLKDILKNNSGLKLIMMSATIDIDIFEKYFSCATICVPGILYPVKMHFLDDIDIFKEEFLSESNLMKTDIPFDKIVDLIKWIIRTKPPGSILCFLPGWQEIKYLRMLLQNTKMNNLLIVPVHSNLANMYQEKIFAPVPDDVTKIILATNIAESSITIKDICYVIDTAIKREVSWNEETSLPNISITRVSQTNILQRKGRAGRMKAGESFHLITRKEYDNLKEFPTSEILKAPLEEAVITSKIFSKEKAKDFFNDMIESPSNMSINSAINNLEKLGILDKDENFTNLGERVKHIGLHPKLSKALILSYIFQCFDPLISIVCAFSGAIKMSRSLTEDSHNADLKRLKQKYHDTSDHIAIVKFFNNLNEENVSPLFYTPEDNYVNTVKKLRTIYFNEITNSGIIPLSCNSEYMNMYSDNNELIRAILFASTGHLIKRHAYGYKKKIFTKNANLFITESGQHVAIKNGSVNYGRKTWPSDILTYIFTMKFVERRTTLAIDTSLISPLTVLLFSSGDVYCSRERIDKFTNGETVFIKINGIENLSFYCEEQTANVLLTFRDILWKMVNFLIKHENTLNYQNNLQDVQRFKTSLMLVLSEMLKESSKNIDNTYEDSLF